MVVYERLADKAGGEPPVPLAVADVGSAGRLARKLFDLKRVADAVQEVRRPAAPPPPPLPRPAARPLTGRAWQVCLAVARASANWASHTVQTRRMVTAERLLDYYTREPALPRTDGRPSRTTKANVMPQVMT